ADYCEKLYSHPLADPLALAQCLRGCLGRAAPCADGWTATRVGPPDCQKSSQVTGSDWAPHSLPHERQLSCSGECQGIYTPTLRFREVCTQRWRCSDGSTYETTTDRSWTVQGYSRLRMGNLKKVGGLCKCCIVTAGSGEICEQVPFDWRQPLPGDPDLGGASYGGN